MVVIHIVHIISNTLNKISPSELEAREASSFSGGGSIIIGSNDGGYDNKANGYISVDSLIVGGFSIILDS